MIRSASPLAPHLTFRGNSARTRHGWLRLTPAYSVELVRQILPQQLAPDSPVLDPFCGTGTTALVCAERGILAETTDINPFLLWLARVKAQPYSSAERRRFQQFASLTAQSMLAEDERSAFVPQLHQIEKWWDPVSLSALGRGMAEIRRLERIDSSPAIDLLKVSFCQTMIEHSQVSFGHQSMSFRKNRRRNDCCSPITAQQVAETWSSATRVVSEGAAVPVAKSPSVLLCDARDLTAALTESRYACVITSPPYPNRMSYVRELRPYMYWLGYLSDGHSAGELDWQAIGGTWGCATSRLSNWKPQPRVEVPHAGFDELVERIGQRSPILARYVTKYFHDMVLHARSLYRVSAPGAKIHYIVGNSKFYDVLLPVERIFMALFREQGFRNTAVRTLRKRTSKRELYEFLVSAHKPKR
jgi:SAM-dependent methyltransferase